MKGLRLIGDILFEFFAVTLLLALSIALVLPSVAMTVGVVGYFQTDINTRRLKDIFTTIGKNIKIIVLYTLFELVLLAFSILNIYFFNTHPESVNGFVNVVSYITLFIGAVYLVHAPLIIVKMNVTFTQLLYNGIMLIFGGWWRSILALGVIAAIAALVMYFPYIVPATLYFVPFSIAKLLDESFWRLKAKALNVPVAKLKKRSIEDDYLDEYGEVDHSESEITDCHAENNDEKK